MEGANPTVPTPTELSKAAGISVPYAWQLLNPGPDGRPRTPSLALAIRIYRATQNTLKLGPIADATDAEIAILERFQGAA